MSSAQAQLLVVPKGWAVDGQGNHFCSPAEERESRGVKLRETRGKKGRIRNGCSEGRKTRTVLARRSPGKARKNNLSGRRIWKA